MSGAGEDHADVRFPPPLVYVLGLTAGSVLHAWIGGDSEPSRWRAALLALGVALAVGGLGITIWGAVSFQRAKTEILPFRPATSLVLCGPYRFTRNPMYLGFAVAYAGFALWLNVLWALVFLPVVIWIIDRGAIAREERYLDRRFGAEYQSYRHQVRRWIGRG